MAPVQSPPQNLEVDVEPGSIEQAPQQFYDGIVGVAISPSVSKVHFHQVTATDLEKKIEHRKVLLTAVLPTSALIEFCVNTIVGLSSNSDVLQGQLEQHSAKVIEMIGQFSIPANRTGA